MTQPGLPMLPGAEDSITTESGYGPLTVPTWLMRLWNMGGWPDEATLQQMVRDQRALEAESSRP